MAEYKKPLPAISSLSEPYWTGLKHRDLKLQRCNDCQHTCGIHRDHFVRAVGRATSPGKSLVDVEKSTPGSCFTKRTFLR